jgi:hypothetical protein
MQHPRCRQLSLDSQGFPSIPQTDNAVHYTKTDLIAGGSCSRLVMLFAPLITRSTRSYYDAYKIKEKHYVSIETREEDDEPREKIEAKLAAGKETLELRDQVNRRFFQLLRAEP